MWVRTMVGQGSKMVNLDQAGKIQCCGEGSIWAVFPFACEDTDGELWRIRLADYSAEAEAEAALDQLHEWIDLDGMSELEGTAFPSRVFDFRKLEVKP